MEDYLDYKYNMGSFNWVDKDETPKQDFCKSELEIIHNIEKYMDKLEDDIVIGNNEWVRKETVVNHVRDLLKR